MPGGARVARGKVPAAGLASSEAMSKSRSRRFPVTVTQPPVTAARSATAPSRTGPGTSARS
jgi:hypothetical protein